MALTLVTRRKTSIGTLELDAAVSVTYSNSADVTSHPVEQGADVSDHVRAQPLDIKIEGVISNTPIASTATASSGRSMQAFAELQKLLEDGTPVDIVSGDFFPYKNMVIYALDVPRDARSGDALFFTASLRQIRQVKGDSVVLTIPKGVKKKSQGAKPKEVAPAKKGSLLSQSLNAVESALGK